MIEYFTNIKARQVGWDEIIISGIIPQLLTLIILPLLFRLFIFLIRSKNKKNDKLSFKLNTKIIVASFLLSCYFPLNLFFPIINKILLGLFRVLKTPIIDSGNSSISLVTIVMIALIIYVSFYFSKLIQQIFVKNLLHNLGLGKQKINNFRILFRYIIMTFMLIIGLGIVGVDITSLSVFLGAAGLGLSFGMQGLVSNFVSGIIIMTSGTVRINDIIRIDGEVGSVVDIHITNTVLRSLDNESFIIPNSSITSKTFENFSYSSRDVTVNNHIGVAYNSDIDYVVKLLQEVGKRCPMTIAGTDVTVWLDSFGDSSINMIVRTQVADVQDRLATKSWINMEIWRTFKEQNITIPFPQRDLHLIADADEPIG